MKSKFTLFLVLAIMTQTSWSQEFKKNAIGFGFTLIDFETAQEIKNGSFNDALKGDNFGNIESKIPAFNIDYWRAITNHIDLSVRYTGAFIEYPFENRIGSESSNSVFSQLDAALNIKLLKETAVVNPFLTAGIGGLNYKKDFAAIAPLGVGIQFNLGNSVYIIPQAQYRFGLSNDATDHLQYSVSILQSLFTPKEKPVVPVYVPPVIDVPKDTDGDGITDEKDECPTVAGTAAFNGCPDSDRDGIADKNDKCPNQAGLAKYQGCPIPDSDSDGINDEEDKCPNQAGLARYQGCPIPDTDNDGVNNEVDKCPNVAGPASNNGCPTLEQYNFNYKNIQFATGSAVLTTGAKAELDKLVTILNEHPELKISIEGHTDITGKAAFNQTLSEKRAGSVKTYLVAKAISTDRLTAIGFGITDPIADNATAAGRAQNRRVEFKASE
jgi:outer membrane protein OmpA-like peptidoglycan-associated protein